MKVLFAVNNENISETIIKKYQSMYKEIIISKNVYYFNAIIKELQKDKSYDRIVISEDLEPFANKNYDTIDNFIFEKLDKISDEANTTSGDDIPIILIATDRRTKQDSILSKIFGIGVYSTLIGQDRNIVEVCKLINKPRTKKEAKIYYKIDSSDVDYKAESENEVSELEIQNILTHYKRLGKNEEKYIESFESIANQYSDDQLRIIIKFLPLSVKAVLEENCPRYQQISVISGEKAQLRKQQPYSSTQINPKTKKARSTTSAVTDDGIMIETIKTTDTKKMTKPVIIPSTTNEVIKKSKKTVPNIQEEIVQVELEQPVKRGRGRPRKVQTVENIKKDEVINTEEVKEPVKKKRGRPRKVQIEEKSIDTKIEEENILPGFEEVEETILPGFEEIDDKQELLGFDKEEETVLPGFEDIFEDDKIEEEVTLPGFEEDYIEEKNIENNYNKKIEQDTEPEYETNTVHVNYTENYRNELTSNYVKSSSLENLLTGDKKVVAFVGTTKNGTSFMVNNLAEMLSNQGVKTAILDLTKNKNAYYIYTKNEEELRKKAVECIEKLAHGIAEGITVNKNLDVYTTLPGGDIEIKQYEAILETLAQNYSLILLDCDFNTDYGYLKTANEIYLVQSMDVLTIQPLTAYLRDLKAKQILDQNKLKIIINKYTKVRSVTEKTIIGGMAFYNDPSMSFMTELFNRETIRYNVVPFDSQVYAKYLEGLINCNITTNSYSKDFMNSLRKVANMVYPLIENKQNKYNNPKYNQYMNKNNFSNINNTLNKMRNY